MNKQDPKRRFVFPGATPENLMDALLGVTPTPIGDPPPDTAHHIQDPPPEETAQNPIDECEGNDSLPA